MAWNSRQERRRRGAVRPAREARSIPGLNTHGFISFTSLSERAGVLGERGFMNIYGVPALVLEIGRDSSTGGSSSSSDTREASFRATVHAGADDKRTAEETARYIGLVAFLTKRPGNPFESMVSFGRAANADLTFTVSSISKMHGYFKSSSDGWRLVDHDSTNGCLVNRERIPQREGVLLQDHDRLRLGPDLPCVYLEPGSLYRRCQG